MTAPSPCSNRSRHRASRAAGFTLAELLVSVVSMAVLMVGIGSAILLATHSIDDGQTPSARTHQAAAAADRIIQDVGCALTVSEASSTALTFTVADRDSDEQAETIRYAWSGTAGDPLTVQYNGGTIVELVQNVQEFDLSYDLKTVLGETPGPTEEQPDVPVVNIGIRYTALEYIVSTNTWCGLSFLPDPASMPANAISWRLDSFAFLLGGVDQLTGMTTAQLCTADASGLPTSTVLDEFQIDEGTLSKKTVISVSFPEPINAPWLAPTEGLCLVLKAASGVDTCQALYTTDTNPEAVNVSFVETSNAGATWTAHSDQSMPQCYAFATVKTQGAPVVSDRDYLTRTGISLRVGPDASTRIDTAVEILNTPEVTGL